MVYASGFFKVKFTENPQNCLALAATLWYYIGVHVLLHFVVGKIPFTRCCGWGGAQLHTPFGSHGGLRETLAARDFSQVIDVKSSFTEVAVPVPRLFRVVI